MKKNALILGTLAIGLAFSSCNTDSPENGTFTKEQEKKIIEEINAEDVIEYNEQNQKAWGTITSFPQALNIHKKSVGIFRPQTSITPGIFVIVYLSIATITTRKVTFLRNLKCNLRSISQTMFYYFCINKVHIFTPFLFVHNQWDDHRLYPPLDTIHPYSDTLYRSLLKVYTSQ